MSGEDRQPQFLFQRISVFIQRFNAVLLYDGFVIPSSRLVSFFIHFFSFLGNINLSTPKIYIIIIFLNIKQLSSSKCEIGLQQAVREAATICPHPLQVDLYTLKVVSESRVTWPTSVPISVFLGLSVLDLGPMYVTDRQTSDVHHRLMPYLGAGHNNA